MLKRIIACILIFTLTNTFVFAEGTFEQTYRMNINFDTHEITMKEQSIYGEVDNSSLMVDVIKSSQEGQSLIYNGPLSGYDNGAWVNTNFGNAEYLMVLDWATMDSEAIYIVPIRETIGTVADASNKSPDFALNTENVDFSKLGFVPELKDDVKIPEVKIAEGYSTISCIPDKDELLNSVAITDELPVAQEQTATPYALSNFSFDANLLTTFNTITAPISENGANEPKFSYNKFVEENISDYSGELTLNFEDLVLDGRNGLDLRIGRTYQTVAAGIGNKSIVVMPAENGRLYNYLMLDYSSYLLDRYNLGVGWGFSFPSVQIETEYIPQESGNTFYYEEEKELYYHSGNGDVYTVNFTSDTTDSNLKGYYKKDIQFNNGDTFYSNGEVTSYYSMTLSDKTKQYFAEDGRLLGIVDRFGNTINFEYNLSTVVNIVPEGNFKNGNEIWATTSSAGTYDVVSIENSSVGSLDNYVMYFKRDNQSGNTYIMSRPIQVKPTEKYKLGVRAKNPSGDDIKVEVIGYDTLYNYRHTETFWIKDYELDTWTDLYEEFSMSTAVRYIQIKITPESAEGTYIDAVSLDELKPQLSKITDSVGRTVSFNYDGDLISTNSEGTVTLTVSSPDNSATKILTYTKEAIEFEAGSSGNVEQRLLWYLNSSRTEGDDGATAKYEYRGGVMQNNDGTDSFVNLYSNYYSKSYSEDDSKTNKLVLSKFKYNDRIKAFEYEPVRKHLGDDGYYDTLRIKKTYDMYSYVPEGETKSHFKGELNAVAYSYEGTYNGNVFNNETGYPDYTFDDETTLNEQWTVTKTGKTTDSVTFSNCAVIQKTSSSGGTTLKSDYTNHSFFRNSPTQIKNTVIEDGKSKETYLVYSYNDWGGLASETKAVDVSVKNESDLLEKYTTSYVYNDTYHFITEKRFYNNIDEAQVRELYTYGTKGVLTKSKNTVGKETQYYYENPLYPGLLTKTTQNDPMEFHGLMGGGRNIVYSYDSYGLYPISVTENYNEEISQTSYVYDYITGDVLRETLPDGSYTDYTYYSDGKVEKVISPFVQYLDGKMFYTVEYHFYHTDAMCENYTDEIPTYTYEEIRNYRVFANESTGYLYALEYNMYDAVGNLKVNEVYDLSKTDDNNMYLRYGSRYYHDTYDRLIKAVDNENNIVLYSYDGFDRPLSLTDSENNVYNYSYDNVENSVILSLNGSTEATDRLLLTQKFDNYGNVIEQIAYPDNSELSTLSEQYEYDLAGNIVSYTNPNGNKTSYSYDEANRLKETVLPNGVKAKADYSSFDEPAFEKIYDSEENERLSRITYRNEKGDLNMKFFGYDKKLTDLNGYSTDSKGRVTNIREGENPKVIIYDESDNPIVVSSGDSQIHRRYGWWGELWSASTDGNTTEISYDYDALGNLNNKLQNTTHNIYYEYSSLGNIVQGKMPSERGENYTYTANGNLDTIVSDNKTFDYDYYDTGYVKSIAYPNGLKTSYNYDNINRVTSMTTTKGTSTINTLLYEYDSNGNVISETRNGAETTYAYDSLDRLLSVTYSDGSSVTYEYDALNNRTKETYSNGDVKDYVYDAKYQLKEIKLNGQITDTFTYNESGAVVTHNDKIYSYDEWDRMSGYSDGTDSYAYKYDANGIRTQKNDKQYIIDINNNVVAETDSTGAITDEILWGHQPLARKVNGSWYYYIYNAHGDVVGLVNEAGTVVNTYEYTPWGEIRNETETVDNPIKYAGEYYDDELDMIYLRARYYNPQIGRFTSLDIEEGEIASPLDMNRYVYCRNNPIKYVDPSGENWIYNAWNWGEDAIWKGIAVGISAVGWQLTADLLWLAASGSGNTFTATAGSYASNLAKNDSGINKKVNDIIWDYGTSQGKTYISTPKISYEIPLSNGDLGAALHWVSIQVNASRQNDGSWYANVTITDTFDFTEFKNPFKQGSVVKGLLWLANDIAYFDTEWSLLDPVGVTIKYNNYY